MPLPRPQDLLKSYFNDLLYDEEAEHLARLNPQPSAQPQPQLSSKTQFEPAIAPAQTNMAASESEASSLSIGQASSSQAQTLKPQKAIQVDYLIVKPQTQVSEQEAIYQLQRQRLQSLLNSLTTTEEVTTESTETVSTESLLLSEPLPIVESITLAVEDTPLASHWLDNGRPNWAQEPFDILLLEVHGIKLAVPLAALGHIHKINKDNISLFGQAKWLLGLQKTIMGNIKAVDTARFVMPERYKPSLAQQYQYTVVINGLKWGLAVNGIDQPITIDPEHIRWRPRRSQRPWMAGTVKDHMCVLLDIPVFGEILAAEDHNENP